MLCTSQAHPQPCLPCVCKLAPMSLSAVMQSRMWTWLWPVPTVPSLPPPECGRRYKTSPSLKAHCTQYHGGEGIQQHSPSPSLPPPPPTPPAKPAEEKVPVLLPPPPNMQGRGSAKPNPYCDFCLGDNSGNKKSGKAERMVSCADCGRSGEWGRGRGQLGGALVGGVAGGSLVGVWQVSLDSLSLGDIAAH